MGWLNALLVFGGVLYITPYKVVVVLFWFA